MSSNKQYTRGNGGNGEFVSKPTNNNELAEQLKAAILGECYPADMSKNKEGCLKFSVRGGQLAINHILHERELSPKSLELKPSGDEPKKVVGMSRSGLKTMLMILDAALKETEPIDHATVFIYYSVEDNGDYANGKLVVERGIHHPRY
jgi:hypothetical protein